MGFGHAFGVFTTNLRNYSVAIQLAGDEMIHAHSLKALKTPISHFDVLSSRNHSMVGHKHCRMVYCYFSYNLSAFRTSAGRKSAMPISPTNTSASGVRKRSGLTPAIAKLVVVGGCA